MPIRHERSAMSTRELFVAGVAIVNDYKRATCDCVRDLPDPILREDGHFDALAGFGMNAVAVEEFQFFVKRRKPGFTHTIVFERDVEFAGSSKNFHGQSIEEFVGEDNQGRVRWEATMNHGLFLRRLLGDYRFAASEVILESILQFCAQRGRRFLQGISEAGEEVVEFLAGPIEHIAREQTTPGAEFEDFDFGRPIERLPRLVKLS